MVFLLLVNGVIAYYVSVSHASGAINALQYLREQHNDLPAKFVGHQSFSQPSAASLPSSPVTMTVGFLMPCHSTPWRSHLVFPTVDAWALTCEPPIMLNETQKATYLDEADQFYENPAAFLHANMVGGTRHLPGRPSYQTNYRPSVDTTTTTPRGPNQPTQTKHDWPDYLVFFAQLEPLLQSELRSSAYSECHRTWNTAWHDDWRRKGDIIVWCLDASSQRDWQQELLQRRERKRQQRWRSAFSWFRGSTSSQTQTQSALLRKRERHFDKIVEELKKEAAVGGASSAGKKNSGQKWGSRWWDLSSLTQPWTKYQWPKSLSSFSSLSSPWGKKMKIASKPWIDVNPYFQRLPSSSWSRLFRRESGNKVWWRDWVESMRAYWPKKKNSPAGGSSDDNRDRNLWL